MPFTRRVLIALTIGLAAAAASADDLTTGAGKKFTGKLVGIDTQGVTFSTGDARVTFAGKDILLIDMGHKVTVVPKDVKFNEIELTDGSTFRAGKYTVKARKIETELATVPDGVAPPAFELPLSAVFSVMRGADDPKNRESWKKVLGSRGKRDIYVERTTSGLNPIQGTILSGSDDGKMFEFELESGDKKSLLQRTATGGLIFAQPTPTQVPQTLCKVIDVFGNSLVAQSVQVNGESVTVTTVAGVVVKYPTLAGISRFDYAQGNVAYLSDLEPQVTVPPVPPDEKGLRLNVTAPFLRDHGLSGEALKFGSDPPFPKGIVITSDVELTYNIGGDYREFKAVLGMPENIADANLEAKVIIMADDKIAFSETIKRKDKPRSIGLDVKGVKQLRVIVDSEMPVTGSRVVLADARVQK